jgi:serine/threonine-protein kinase
MNIDTTGTLDPPLDDIIIAYIEAVETGQNPNRSEWLKRHPQHANELRLFFADQDKVKLWTAPLRTVAQADDDTPPVLPVRPGTGQVIQIMGDFELQEEIGRGGMGVVFKARQLSLNRAVALKIARVSGPEQGADSQRFRNEAETVAQLDHPHIVPIFEVGSWQGQPYFSMKLIEGGSLAGHLDRFKADPKKAARLMAQVARAVHHAHLRGVLHRDLKPSNILLDSEGRPHVTDFGLARRVAMDSNVTQSGALVGTPSYMAPEQTSGLKGAVTTAADVYGLGAVLYALLTGRPPFRAATTLDTLTLVREAEPAPLRKYNRKLSRDLETVCLKCLSKDPPKRYGSAEALADDLERWLRGEPVSARRITIGQRLGRWASRHKPVAWASAVVLLFAALFGGATGLWWAQKRAGAEAAARAALDEAARLGQEERWREAMSATKRATEVLAGVGADPDLRKEVEELDKDLEMGGKLQEASLQASMRGMAAANKDFDWEGSDSAYADAFRWYGLEWERLDPSEATDFIRSRSIKPQLVAALDNWAEMRRAAARNWKPIIAMSRVVDPDPWRNRLRDAFEFKEPAAIEKVIASVPWDTLPPDNALFLMRIMRSTIGEDEKTIDHLLKARSRNPADFWFNHHLGVLCRDALKPPRVEDAIRFLSIAVALRPGSPGARHNLGRALGAKGQRDEAIAEYRAALALDPNYGLAHNSLGVALHGERQWEEAIVELRAAIAINPKFAGAHSNLGTALSKKGELDAAILEYRTSIALGAKKVAVHINLGMALKEKGAFQEAILAWRTAIELHPDDATGCNNLSWLLATCPDSKFRDPRLAVQLAKRAVELTPMDGTHWNTLGVAHYRAGSWRDAIAALEKSMLFRKGGNAFDWFFLAMTHWQLGDMQQARKWYDKAALRMDKNRPKDAELLSFRAEARELLGIQEPLPAPGAEPVPKKDGKP